MMSTIYFSLRYSISFSVLTSFSIGCRIMSLFSRVSESFIAPNSRREFGPPSHLRIIIPSDRASALMVPQLFSWWINFLSWSAKIPNFHSVSLPTKKSGKWYSEFMQTRICRYWWRRKSFTLAIKKRVKISPRTELSLGDVFRVQKIGGKK